MEPIKPDRTNWKQFCQESPLTDAEIAEWNEMALAITQNDTLFDIISDQTVSEWDRAYNLRPPTESWTDVVEWANANRALQRAEIRAYQKWNNRVKGKQEDEKRSNGSSQEHTNG